MRRRGVQAFQEFVASAETFQGVDLEAFADRSVDAAGARAVGQVQLRHVSRKVLDVRRIREAFVEHDGLQIQCAQLRAVVAQRSQSPRRDIAPAQVEAKQFGGEDIVDQFFQRKVAEFFVIVTQVYSLPESPVERHSSPYGIHS